MRSLSGKSVDRPTPPTLELEADRVKEMTGGDGNARVASRGRPWCLPLSFSRRT